jgi:hypothetical protein
MADADWLPDWNPRFARVLAQSETSTARAALVDSNGDGRELWFGLDVRSPSGQWDRVIDQDDTGGHQPTERVIGTGVIYSWGTGQPRERKTVEYEGSVFPVRVQRNGWWLLVATVPRT